MPTPGSLPGRTTVAACALLGFVLPWLSPLSFVRYCPDGFRHSFPFVFAVDRMNASGSTLLAGVVANTVLVGGLALVAVALIRRARFLRPVASRLRYLRANALAVLVSAAVLIVLFGFESPTTTLDIVPADVDTDACRHVTGHTIVNNWWGPERLVLLGLEQVLQ